MSAHSGWDSSEEAGVPAMERDSGAADGDLEREDGGERAAAGRGGLTARSNVDVLILAAEPAVDTALRTSAYGLMRTGGNSGGRATERLALYLLRLLTGVLVGGATMLATTRWTHLDSSVVKDAFFAVLIALMTLVAAAAGFYYGAGVRDDGRAGNDEF